MTEMDDFLEQLELVFLEEYAESLEKIEVDLLSLEKTTDRTELIQSLFRNFHNIKGSSKTVGFQKLSEFAHLNEAILSQARDGVLDLSEGVVECLLQSLDKMQHYLELKQQGEDAEAMMTAAVESWQPPSSSDSSSTLQPPGEGIEFLIDPEVPCEQQASADGDEPLRHGSHHPKLEVEVQTSVKTQEHGSASPQANKPLKKAKAPPDEILKTPLSRVNRILDLFGEQLILQSALESAVSNTEIDTDFVRKSLSQLNKITRDLQFTLMSLRTVSLQSLFNRLERSVRDAAHLTGKQVNFVRVGDNNELDKSIVDALADPLNHMVRNAVDHGIEGPQERESQGKNRSGTITLSAARVGSHFEMVLEDDGAGLNTERILEKAIKAGIVSEGSRPSDGEIHRLIFHSGLSTRDQASELSGRGVGMDVVKQQIEALKGSCTLESQKGHGSRFTIRLPLSIAMFNGTIVRVDGQRYVIANSEYQETISFHDGEQRETESGHFVVRRGERVISVIDCRSLLKLPFCGGKREPKTRLMGLVVVREGASFALVVDEILSQQQVVLKRFGPEARQIRYTSGGTILGDGSVALILDVNRMVEQNLGKQGSRRVA